MAQTNVGTVLPARAGDVRLDALCPYCFVLRESDSRGWVTAATSSSASPAPLSVGRDRSSAVRFVMRPFRDVDGWHGSPNRDYWRLASEATEDGATCVRDSPQGAVLTGCRSDSGDPAEGVVARNVSAGSRTSLQMLPDGRVRVDALACARDGGCREWTWHARSLDPAVPNQFELYTCTQPACAAADRLHLLHNLSAASHASSFEAVCQPCSRTPSAQAFAGVVAAVAFLSLAPMALIIACHCHRKRRARRAPAAAPNPWPRLPKPWVVSALFVVSWATLLGAFAPPLLWASPLRWYFAPSIGSASGSVYTLVRLLGPPAMEGISLCLRSDDTQRKIQAVSALQASLGVLGLYLLALGLAEELSRPSWRLSGDTPYREWFTTHPLCIESAAYALSFFAVWLPLQLPIHLPRACGSHGVRGPSALLRLWRTSRAVYAVCAVCCFTIALASQVALHAYGHAVLLPSEVLEAQLFMRDWWASGCAWLVAYVLTSPRLRLRLHLWSVRLGPRRRHNTSHSASLAAAGAQRRLGLGGRPPRPPSIVTGIPINTGLATATVQLTPREIDVSRCAGGRNSGTPLVRATVVGATA